LLLTRPDPSFSDGYSFQENSKVWTLPAKVSFIILSEEDKEERNLKVFFSSFFLFFSTQIFFLCISLFVLSTVGMLVALEISNVTTFEDRRGSPAILQPQAIVSE